MYGGFNRGILERERTGTANASLAPSFAATSPYIATLFLYFWKNTLSCFLGTRTEQQGNEEGNW